MKQPKKTEKAGAPEKPQKTEAPKETGILMREQFFPTLIYSSRR